MSAFLSRCRACDVPTLGEDELCGLCRSEVFTALAEDEDYRADRRRARRNFPHNPFGSSAHSTRRIYDRAVS